MSKKLIAGAGVVASMAVALAPLATFAAPQTNPRGITDTLSVTIEKLCSFGYTAGSVAPGAHVNGTAITGTDLSSTYTDTPISGKTAGGSYGKWDSLTLTAYDIPATGEPTKSGQTAYGVMETGTNNPLFAQTKMVIFCNDKDGYTLTATPHNLVAADSNNSANIVAGGYGDSVTTSTWGYKFAETDRSRETGAPTNENSLVTAAESWNANATATNVIAQTSDVAHPTNNYGDAWTVTYGVSVASNLPADTYAGTIDYLLAEI